MRFALIAVCLFAPLAVCAAQGEPPPTTYHASWADVAAVGVTGASALLPNLLKLPSGPPSCAPCDPSGLAGIDRGAVGLHSSLAQTGSNMMLLGVGGLSAYLTLHDRSAADVRGNLAVLGNAISWTAGSTEWLKVLVRRKRPVMYTSGAIAAATATDNQRSFPSGHTSVAFSMATAYLVMANREHLPHRTRNALLLYTGAAAVGALRVASGSHFPTDVLGGAAFGTGMGWLVAVLHPHSP